MSTYKSCPFAIVNASAEKVWELLLNPEGWGGFFDMKVKQVTPSGKAKVGSRVIGITTILGLKLVGEFAEINVAKGELRLKMDLPFGLHNDERIEISPLAKSRCMVKYNCNLSFRSGFLGTILFTLLRGQFDSGPADSLSRLKREAEKTHQ